MQLGLWGEAVPSHTSHRKICTIAGCLKPVHGKGLCINHYMRGKKYNVHRRAQTLTCEGCGNEYQATSNACKTGPNKRKYCTHECWANYHRPHNKHPGTLRAYIPRPRWMRLRLPLRQPTGPKCFTAGQCANCHVWFIANTKRRTCSKQCADDYKATCRALARQRHQQRRRANGKARLAKERRRARKANAYVADVHPEQIYRRDHYRCQAVQCAFRSRKVDMSKTAPHPKAPTIDHMIPLACGGTHEPANCVTAHFLCNCLKGDRGGGEQLALGMG